MKIVFMAQVGSVHVNRWSTGLAAHGHQVTIISNNRYRVETPGVETICLPGWRPPAYFLNLGRVKSITRRLKPDIVHAHYITGYGLWGMVQDQAPLIVSAWGTDIEDALRGRFLVAPLVRRVLKKAAFVTAPSRFLIQRIAAFEKTVVDKIVRIPFGLPNPGFTSADRPDRKDDFVRVIFAKSFRPAYAPEVALEAFGLACRENPSLRLTMIGGGPMKKRLQATAARLGLTGQVSIEGWQNESEARRLISNSDVMLMPSRQESFGVAALEASLHGIPVVASRIGGLPEIVEDGVNGLLTPVDDVSAIKEALLNLASDPQKRRIMGEAGRRIAREKFPFEKSLELMENLYRRAAADYAG